MFGMTVFYETICIKFLSYFPQQHKIVSQVIVFIIFILTLFLLLFIILLRTEMTVTDKS